MAKVNADRFLELLGRSGLVEEEQLAGGIATIMEESGGQLPNDSEELADRLVQLSVITRWQANNLLSGKHKGFILGKYKLLGHLGSGGMSSVYLAEHMKMRHRVAVKVLPRSKVEDSSYLARFELEARAVAALNHRNIVRAFDTDNDGMTYYLVMEYVEGPNLQALVKDQGPLDYELAANYVAQAAEGLQHAHDNGLTHRDIKPANLLVDPNTVVKVLDMGLAKFSGDKQPSLTIQHDENVLGTADYLAPEQAINSHSVDHRADIYSLGCTFYYLLTGHPPFNEGTMPQRLMKHQTQMPPSIYEDRPDAPQPLVNICLRMMAKAPEARYQRADEIAHDLNAWLATARKAPAEPARRGAAGEASARRPGEHASAADSRQKELRTRKPDPKERTPYAPATGDTRPVTDAETFKGPSKNSPSETGEPGAGRPLVRKRPGDSGKQTPGDSDRRSSAKNRKGSARSKSRNYRGRGRPTESGEEFVFDIDAMSDTTTGSGGGQATTPDRSDRPHSTATPTWMWMLIATGAVIALALFVLMLKG